MKGMLVSTLLVGLLSTLGLAGYLIMSGLGGGWAAAEDKMVQEFVSAGNPEDASRCVAGHFVKIADKFDCELGESPVNSFRDCAAADEDVQSCGLVSTLLCMGAAGDLDKDIYSKVCLGK